MSFKDPKSVIALVLSSAFFSTGYLFAKFFEPAAGINMLITQALFSSAVVLSVATYKVSWRLDKKHYRPIALNGVISPIILYFVWNGARIVTPALASTIVISNALMIAVIAWALGRKQFARLEVVALLTGFCGVVWIGLQRGAFGGEAEGIIYLICGAVFIAAITVIIEKPVMEAGSVVVTRWAFWAGFVIAISLTLAMGDVRFYSVEQSALAFTMGALSIAIGVTLFNTGMSRVGAADAAVFKLLIPFFALLYGILFLGEFPGTSSSVGALVVISSVGLYQYANAKKGRL